MPKWILATLLLLGAHFGASYLVPLDHASQREFAGLLKWFWPWADGDSGPLGVMTVSSGFPMSGFLIAVTSAGLLFAAALAVIGVWVPVHWWRFLAGAGAVLSFLLMLMFLGPTKLIPIALDVFLLRAAWTNGAPAPGRPR
jgi:hypothetical protein